MVGPGEEKGGSPELYDGLPDRLRKNDKDGPTEAFYQLLSSGVSVAKLLQVHSVVPRGSDWSRPEPTQSEREGAPAGAGPASGSADEANLLRSEPLVGLVGPEVFADPETRSGGEAIIAPSEAPSASSATPEPNVSERHTRQILVGAVMWVYFPVTAALLAAFLYLYLGGKSEFGPQYAKVPQPTPLPIVIAGATVGGTKTDASLSAAPGVASPQIHAAAGAAEALGPSTALPKSSPPEVIASTGPKQVGEAPTTVPARTPAPEQAHETKKTEFVPAATAASITPHRAKPGPEPPAARLGSPQLTDEAEALVARGDAVLSRGDIASARLFYQRGAEGGDPAAALRLGETFDPAFLAQAGVAAVLGDAKKAAFWYRRASELGIGDAALLLRNIAPAKQQ